MQFTNTSYSYGDTGRNEIKSAVIYSKIILKNLCAELFNLIIDTGTCL